MYRRGIYQLRTEGNPAVVLLDLKMSKINGLKVLEQLKTNDALKQIPVLMLTGSEEQSDLLRSYQLGVNAYVVKPVDFAQFVEEIRASRPILGGRQLSAAGQREETATTGWRRGRCGERPLPRHEPFCRKRVLMPGYPHTQSERILAATSLVGERTPWQSNVYHP